MNGNTFHHAPAETRATQQGLGVSVTSIDDPKRALVFRTMMLIVALEPLVILGVLIALGVPWEVIALIFGSLLVITAGVFWLIVRVLWKPLQRRYPAQPVLAGAVSKSWQSFGFGPLMRLSNCLTIVADERHLHLTPFTPMRWVGAGTVSLPLDRISNVRTSPLTMRMLMTADLDGRSITGPAWCLRLAAGDAA
jgi:hypothetical protein